jgi:hypothetical protein
LRKLFLIICLAVFPVTIRAQDDFGIWFSVSPEFALGKKTDLKFSGAVRTYNNTSQVEQLYLDAGIDYKLSKNLNLSGSYRLIDNIEDNGQYYYRHRLNIDLLGKLHLGRFTIFDRLRIQRVSKTYIETDDDLTPVYSLRGKIGAEYSLSSFPLNPYVYYEGYTPISPDPALKVDKFRLSAGGVLKITRKISVDAAYLFQRDLEKKNPNIHVISIDLKLKF